MKRKKLALISVWDKTGIEVLARALCAAGYSIIATAGTLKYLSSKKIAALPVEELTGFPEILDGRVKTLHPSVFGGVLAAGKSHLSEIKKFSIQPIDLVVVNFYPFEKVAADISCMSMPEDMIDIGGVALLRAAAKNYVRVLAVSSVLQYDEIIACLRRNRGLFPLEMRKEYAAQAFAATARYDAVISSVMSSDDGAFSDKKRVELRVGLKQKFSLRYGENPHQKAIFCSAGFSFTKPADSLDKGFISRVADIESLGNKNISYNNLLDADAGISIVGALGNSPACAIIKHTNPCGVALAADGSILEAYRAALSTDRVSAFGGVAVFNKAVDYYLAREITKIFTDCVVAPDFSRKALEIFRAKKNLALIKIRQSFAQGLEIRSCLGGVLVQNPDGKLAEKDLRVVTKKKPTKEEIKSLLFAYAVAKYAKSNAIVIARGAQTLGIGAGLASRIDALRLAASKTRACATSSDRISQSKKESEPIVLASDGFFPFDDVVKEAAALPLGISAIIQPGGSIRDAESIRACDEAGIAMVFAGVRHFRH